MASARQGMRELHDHFFKQARTEGYRSRAAYKLIEIDDRRRLLRRGDWVLDAGCAPGSWLQVAAARVGERGRVVGIDLKECDRRGLPPNVRTVQGDLVEVTLAELLGPWENRESRDSHQFPGHGAAPPDRQGVSASREFVAVPVFNVLLSDMGPDTTGDPAGDSARSIRLCHALLDRAAEWLRPGGHLVMKVYEGGEYPELLRRARGLFEEAKGFKPEASRRESVEIYLVGKGWRGRGGTRAGGEAGDASEAPPEDTLRPRRPRGWGT